MAHAVSLPQLPRLCILADNDDSNRILSGVGPHLEQYRLQESGDYRLISRTSVFGACGRPITGITRVQNSDTFVITGSSLFTIVSEPELQSFSEVPAYRIRSFTDEIVTVGYAVKKEDHVEAGLVLRSGRTICVRASIDTANRLNVDTVAEYDRAKCGLLMSALCILPGTPNDHWEQMQSIAGSAMGEVRLWDTVGEGASRGTTECGKIGFVIAMAVIDRCDERGETTVLAVTENRAVNLWRVSDSEASWLQLLHRSEAAHSVRPSAVAYCSRRKRAVTAAEDGELCLWSVSSDSFALLQRFQTRVGAIRSLSVDSEGRIIYGSATGSLFVLPLESLEEAGEGREMGRGSTDWRPIRSFAVVRVGEEGVEMRCLEESGSPFTLSSDEHPREEKKEEEGRFMHLNSWTDQSTSVALYHSESRVRMELYGGRGPGCSVILDESLPSGSSGDSDSHPTRPQSLLTARPTLSRRRRGEEEREEGEEEEVYAVLQTTGGAVVLIRFESPAGRAVRVWRYRMPSEEDTVGGGKREGQMPILNTVAIDRSQGEESTDLHVILGTTKGRILYAPLREGKEVPNGTEILDFALNAEVQEKELILHPRSPRLEKTSITQLEYCREGGECRALSKNGWMMRMRVERGSLIVTEEEISREVGVEWPIRIERRGEEEYVVGFNGRNLVVVSRRLKTCLLSIDCGGGHRQVHVDLESAEGGGRGGEVERITVYYIKHERLIQHRQRSLCAGMRQLAWTPHREKIVYCIAAPPSHILAGSIDGEIVMGRMEEEEEGGSPRLSLHHRWYLPETTAAAIERRREEPSTSTLIRLVVGGPKGGLYAAEWREEEEEEKKGGTAPPLSLIKTGNESRVIDIALLPRSDLVAVAFADAEIVLFRLSSPSPSSSIVRGTTVGRWAMPPRKRSMYMKIAARLVNSTVRLDAAGSDGTLSRLEWAEEGGEFSLLDEHSIDRAALTVLKREEASGVMVVGTDAGAVFVYRDHGDKLELVDEMRNAHVTQVTDIALTLSSTGRLRLASVGMECECVRMEMDEEGKLTFLDRRVFAVNDPSAVNVMSKSKLLIAGCGMELLRL